MTNLADTTTESVPKHDWQCISPGEHESQYQCTRCGQKGTDSIDEAIPRGPCVVKRGNLRSRLWHYRCHILDIVDGDTIDVEVDLGFGLTIQKSRLRLARIDAPEVRGSEKVYGKKAKAALSTMLTHQQYLYAAHRTGRWNALIHSYEIDNFGRPLAELWVGVDYQINVSSWMLEHGHAEEYEE